MTRTAARRARERPAKASRQYRKVTYSLPEPVAQAVDLRSAGAERGKSRLVAEALVFYFAAQDRRALELVYSEAAQDPEFQADNEAVRQDFASLDHEVDGARRAPLGLAGSGETRP
jgi:hypothetical protein